MNLTNRRFVFVPPRYFPGIVGGAERACASFAQKLVELGANVEIWTTCATDNIGWENSLPAGSEVIEGLLIRRFPVDARDLKKWEALLLRLSDGAKLTRENQLILMKENINSEELYRYIHTNAHDADLLFFSPYLCGTTYFGSRVAPEKSVLIPCLHDEAFARLDIIRDMFREVRYSLFNSAPERKLARTLHGEDIKGDVVGLGFDLESVPQNSEPFFKDETQYAIYLGRMESGKNSHLMLDYFIDGKNRGLLPQQLKLVIAGSGSLADLNRNHLADRTDIIQLGWVSEEEKQRLLAHAVTLIQPSVNESFSMVLLEGWLQRCPALVHQHCAVAMDHAYKANGALHFENAEDFAGALGALVQDAQLRKILGNNGRAYVENNYSWLTVLEHFVAAVNGLLDG